MAAAGPASQGGQSNMAASRGRQSPSMPPTSYGPEPELLVDAVSHVLVAEEDPEQATVNYIMIVDPGDDDYDASYSESALSLVESGSQENLLRRPKQHATVGRTKLTTICSILAKTVVSIFLLCVSVSMVMKGLFRAQDCPLIEDLPQVLIFAGVALALRLAVQLWRWLLQCRSFGCCRTDGRSRARLCGLWLELILLVLAVGESVKVYGGYARVSFSKSPHSSDPPARGTEKDKEASSDNSDYCDPLLYWLSFGAISALYGVMLLSAFVPLPCLCRCRRRRCCCCLLT